MIMDKLLEQKEKNEDFSYRDSKGNFCVIGWLLDKEILDQEFQGTLKNLLLWIKKENLIGFCTNYTYILCHYDELNLLQKLHDYNPAVSLFVYNSMDWPYTEKEIQAKLSRDTVRKLKKWYQLQNCKTLPWE